MNELQNKTGLIQVYTGPGKGKTTASLGLAMRALGHGWTVVMIQFMKDNPRYGEYLFSLRTDRFRILQSGQSSFVKKGSPSQEDLRLAGEGMEKAAAVMAGGETDMLILDEINVAVNYGLVREQDLLAFIEQKPPALELVLTGRYASEKVIKHADLVSEVRECKHPYRDGTEARQGIEY